MCSDDKGALDALDRATEGRQGERTDLRNNVTEAESEKSVTGNANTYALRKLRRDRPDLHERVLEGEACNAGRMLNRRVKNRIFSERERPLH